MLLNLIKLLHEEMEQLTIDSGVSPETYEQLIKFEKPVQESELAILHTWLQTIFEGPYSELVKIWKLHPRNRWSYYFLMGDQLTEIKLLNKKRRDLYAAWKKPYWVEGHQRRAQKVPVQSE